MTQLLDPDVYSWYKTRTGFSEPVLLAELVSPLVWIAEQVLLVRLVSLAEQVWFEELALLQKLVSLPGLVLLPELVSFE